MAVVAKKPPVKTQAQLDQEAAARIAATAVDPAKQEILNAIKAAEDQRIIRMKATTGVTDALGRLTAGDAEAHRAAYADAASRAGQYGSMFTGAMRGIQEQGAASASDLIGRLGLGQGVSSQADANVNVTGMLGAVIPGETLAAQAPRALAQAQAHRLAAGLRLAEDGSISDYKAGAEIQGIRAEIAKLEAKRPGIMLEALNDIKQQRNAERATNTQIGYLQLSQAKSLEDQAIAKTNISGTLHIVVGKGKNAKIVDTRKPALGSDAIVAQTRAETSRLNAQTAAATQRAAIRQREEAAKAAEAGRNQRAIDANAAKVTAAKVTAQAKQNKPPTPAQTATILKGANAMGVSALKTVTDKIWSGVESDPKYADDQGKATQEYNRRLKMNKGTLMAQTINSIGPTLRTLKYTDAQIKAIATRLVNAVIPGG